MASIFSGRATGVGPKPIDSLQARQAILFLADPEHSLELRGLPSGRSYVRHATDVDGLIQCASRLGDDRGIYYCLNPVQNGIGDRGARAADIIRRRWLLLDVDPSKPVEFKDASATDAEHEAARQTASKVHDWLSEQGWPAPVLVDSGNGWHLLYRIDLPNDPLSQALVRKVLYVLASRFDNAGATVDKSVHNASRIAKLPGTWARKGPSTTERPHRLCRILFMPAEQEVVPLDLLQKVAGGSVEVLPLETPALAAPAASIFNGTAPTNGTAASYARAALRNEQARVALAVQGERNNALNRAAYSLGGLIASGHLREDEAIEALREAANRAGLDVDPECGPKGIEATIRSGLEAGKAAPRTVPERNGTANHASAADALPAGESIIIRASAITPRHVEWLWHGRIPLGKLTTFAGIGGLGKTFVLCDITARVTTGCSWPDSNDEPCERGQVLFVSGEDDPDDTLVPRFIELGADLNRVAFLKTEVADRFSLADLKTLDKAIEQIGPDVRFVAIDPPTAYLGGVDDHKNAELRALLSPLKSWAARHRVALVFNTHINKGSGQKVEAMMRVMGSVAWVNAVRAAHLFVRDPDEPEKRLFVGMKMNIGKERKGLAYRIVALPNDLARVEWLGEVDTTADQAINRQEKQNRSILAADFLRQLFSGRREIPSEEVWVGGRAAGLSVNAIKDAKAKLRIRAVKRCIPGDHQLWVWTWPDDIPTPPGDVSGAETANPVESGDSMAF